MYDLVEKLKKEIAAFEDKGAVEDVGIVREAGDGIIRLSGLTNAKSQEILSVETDSGNVPALAFNLEEDFIGGMILGEMKGVKVGDRVKATGTVLSVPVGEELIGRVVNPLAEPEDGHGVIWNDKTKAVRYPLEREAPPVIAREPVKIPLHTGIKAIDAMIPIGRGQRELIIGDRQTGKTAVALDTILNQKQDSQGKPPVCIYVAIGQKQSKIARIRELLNQHDAMRYSIIVSAPASFPSSLQYLAPFTGCAIGEFFMEQGRDALVIYDDLTKHAYAYRELSLLLRRPPGREAYPGDIFYLHSRLLERSAKLNKERGGGSLTALPVIETQLGDVSAYIPTNVISITDGQIYLESGLFHEGVRPAVNVGLSVSRVGSSAQTKAMKKVAGRLRLELAQFRELKAFVQFASDLDEDTRKKIRRGELLVEILKQDDKQPMPFEEQVVLICAATSGLMDDIALHRVKSFEKRLLTAARELRNGEILKAVREGDLTDALQEKIKSIVSEIKQM